MEPILDFNEEEGEMLEDLRLYVGQNAPYYVYQWRQIRTGQMGAFHFPAFVFGFLWMLYRQMYQPAILYLSFYFAEGFLEKWAFQYFQPPISPINWFLIRNLIFSIILGRFANWIYLQHSEQQINHLKKRFGSPLYKQKLAGRGGTSWMPILVFVLMLLLILLINRYYLDAYLLPKFS